METALHRFVKPHRKYIVILLLAVTAAFVPLFVGQFYGIGDMRDLHIPLELFFQQELRAGRIPAWNPNTAWGFPVIAAGQIGFFYPLLLVSRWLLPIIVYLPALLLLHFFALAIGLYYLLITYQRSPLAAVLGSLSFTLSAFVFQHLTHFNITLAIAYLPWQLLLAHRLAHSRSCNLRLTAILSVLIALPFLVGQFHIPLLMAGGSSLYFAVIHYQQHRRALRPLLIVGTLAVFTIGLAAVQIFPTLELLQLSSRGPVGDFDLERANKYSFVWYHTPTVLFPRFFGTDDTYWGKNLEVEYGIFFGTIPVLLATWYIVTRWRFRRADGSEFWCWAALISFLLALGNYSPFRLIGLEPSLWFFSAPARWLLFSSLALSILAAFGFDTVRDKQSFRRFVAVITAIIIGGVLLSNLALATQLDAIRQAIVNIAPDTTQYYQNKADSLLTSLTTSSVSLRSPLTWLPIAILLSLPWLLHSNRNKAILVTVTAIELILIAATANPHLPWRELLDSPATVTALPDDVRSNQSRFLAIREGGDTGVVLTNPDTRADDAVRAQQKRLLVPLLHTQWNVSSIEWPASLDITKHTQLLNELRAGEDYQITNPELLRQLNIGALLVPNNLVQPTAGHLTHTIDGINIYALAAKPRAEIVDERGQPVANSHTVYQTINPRRTQIEVNTPTPGQLIVQDTFYPGWKATIDNQPVAIETTDYLFRKVPIPAGQHTVRMYYEAGVVRLSLIASLATLAIVLTASIMHSAPNHSRKRS